jgi:MFS family permease
MTASADTTSAYRRNVPLLALAQALFMSTQAMGIATTPLAALAMLDQKSLATVPIFLNHAGIMLTTIPASLLMGRIGRRAGFTIGAVLAVVFGALAALAVWKQSFELLCAAALLQGSAAAFAWYYRFAAADVSPVALKPRAISYVMLGGLISGFVGPELAKLTVDWFAPFTFLGVYLTISMIGVVSLVLLQTLAIPKLSASEQASGGRPLSQIMRQPTYITALVSSMFGYGIMTLVMSATPLAMIACGYKFHHSATVIQWHIVGMFLPSFFTGHLIQRYGVLAVIIAGAVIELGCALVNLAGIDFWNFMIANVLVGIGWNFCYVGGSTLLTRTYEPAERAKVQASHDFTVYATTATSAAAAGFLNASAGWTVLNLVAIPMMLAIIAAACWLHLKQRVVETNPQVV